MMSVQMELRARDRQAARKAGDELKNVHRSRVMVALLPDERDMVAILEKRMCEIANGRA